MQKERISVSGRKLSPLNVKSNKPKKYIRAIDSWLHEEGVKEAESKEDDFALTLFNGINVEIKNRDGGFLTIAERDMLNLYLFDNADGIIIKTRGE